MPIRPILFLIIVGLTLTAQTKAVVSSEFVVKRMMTADLKTVYGQVLSRDVIPARARIPGTIVSLKVDEGSRVKAGDIVGIVADEKHSLRMRAIDARLASLKAELTNARDELERAETLLARGVTTRQRVDQLRTRLEVVTGQIATATAELAVIRQQATEGEVKAPTDGRVIKVPVTRGSVVMAGEALAQVAGGGFFLRLALPERHAATMKEGLNVSIKGRPSQSDQQSLSDGKIIKIYPELENGHVVADVEVPGLDNYFVGERTLVRIPVATRAVIAIPAAAVINRSGIDFVLIKTSGGIREIVVLLGPKSGNGGETVEVLSGLHEGDTVLVP